MARTEIERVVFVGGPADGREAMIPTWVDDCITVPMPVDGPSWPGGYREVVYQALLDHGLPSRDDRGRLRFGVRA